MNKTKFQAYNRHTTALNAVNRNIADLQAYIQFLYQTENTSELENMNAKLASFLDNVKAEFINTLPDHEAECKRNA